MAGSSGPDLVTSGLTLSLDAADKNSYADQLVVYSVQCYSVYGGGLRSSNYSVQYSDDNSSWTTAFTGVMSNNSACGIITGTGVNTSNLTRHRYWRYVEGSAIASHHPRVSRIDFIGTNGVVNNLITYTSDNCVDSGTYIVGTVSKDFGPTSWKDLSGNGITGTLTNGVTFSAANCGILRFDGTDDNIQLGNASNFISVNGVTVNCWVKTNVIEAYKKIFVTVTAGTQSITGVYFSLGPSPYNYYFGINGVQQALSTTNLSTSQYNNICGTYDKSNIKLYLNGTLLATTAYTTSVSTSGIGRISGYDNGGEIWDGNVASVMVYNRGLTAAEVLQNYNATKSRFGL